MSYVVSIKLTKKQEKDLVSALTHNLSCNLLVRKSQINKPGDKLLLTLAQFNALKKSMISYGGKFNLTLSKKQLKMMKSQIGNGILDNISSFFKNTVSSAKNWFTAKKAPAPIEMKTFNKQDTAKNKAYAFFDDNRTKNLAPKKPAISGPTPSFQDIFPANKVAVKPKFPNAIPISSHVNPTFTIPPRSTPIKIPPKIPNALKNPEIKRNYQNAVKHDNIIRRNQSTNFSQTLDSLFNKAKALVR